MFVLVGLNDEDYAYPIVQKLENREEAMEKMEMDNAEIQVRGDRYDVVWDDDNWIVYEVKEVPDNPYVMINYHAYNGVDFTVASYPSEVEATRQMLLDVGDFMREVNVYEANLAYDGVIVDDDVEWHVWKVVKL